MNKIVYPYIEDILRETNTTRKDWYIGTTAIMAACGYDGTNTTLKQYPALLSFVRKMHSESSNFHFLYLARITDCEAHAKKRTFSAPNGTAPAVVPLTEANRLALLEKAIDANTDMLKTLYHEIHALLDEFKH